MSNHFLLSLGSNISPISNFDAAIEAINKHPNIVLLNKSHFDFTEPYEAIKLTKQVYNGCIIVSTEMNGDLLKKEMVNIEVAQGRPVDMENRKNVDRTIDIDILCEIHEYDAIKNDLQPYILPFSECAVSKVINPPKGT